MRLDLVKSPDHLESVAFLVTKLDSFYGDILRLGLEADSLNSVTPKSVKKQIKMFVVTLQPLIGRGGCIDKYKAISRIIGYIT